MGGGRKGAGCEGFEFEEAHDRTARADWQPSTLALSAAGRSRSRHGGRCCLPQGRAQSHKVDEAGRSAHHMGKCKSTRVAVTARIITPIHLKLQQTEGEGRGKAGWPRETMLPAGSGSRGQHA